jgi:hypothetical protein
VDWANERWVKLYTRDTLTWLTLSWEARSVFCALLRKVDLAGVVDFPGFGASDAVAAIVNCPIEVATIALPQLVARKMVRIGNDSLVILNFIEAQEAKTGDAQRQRNLRERRRSKGGAVTSREHDVTSRDKTSPLEEREETRGEEGELTPISSNIGPSERDTTAARDLPAAPPAEAGDSTDTGFALELQVDKSPSPKPPTKLQERRRWAEGVWRDHEAKRVSRLMQAGTRPRNPTKPSIDAVLRVLAYVRQLHGGTEDEARADVERWVDTAIELAESALARGDPKPAEYRGNRKSAFSANSFDAVIASAGVPMIKCPRRSRDRPMLGRVEITGNEDYGTSGEIIKI